MIASIQSPTWDDARHVADGVTGQFARNWQRGNIWDVEDVRGAAYLGAWNALDHWQPDRGAAFETYCWRGCVQSVRRTLRDYDTLSRAGRAEVLRLLERGESVPARLEAPLSLETLIGAWEGDDDRLAFLVAQNESPLNYTLRRERERTMVAALAQLSARDQWLARVRYYDDLTPTEISKLLHVSQSVVSNQLHRLHKRLGAILETAP